MSTPSMERDRFSELAQAAVTLMASGERSDFDRIIHPEAVNRESVNEPPASRGRGPAAFWATAQWLREAWSDLSFSFDEVVVEGDLVVTHGTMSGRQTGVFVVWNSEGTVERVFPPTGATFEVRQAHFQRVRDELIIEHWAVRDDQGMALQLGWVPPTPLFLCRSAFATSKTKRRERSKGATGIAGSTPVSSA